MVLSAPLLASPDVTPGCAARPSLLPPMVPSASQVASRSGHTPNNWFSKPVCALLPHVLQRWESR